MIAIHFQLPIGLTDEMIWPDYPVDALVNLNAGLASALSAEPAGGGGPISRFLGYKLLGNPRATRAQALAMLPLRPGDPSPFFDPVDDISRDHESTLERDYSSPTALATCGPTNEGEPAFFVAKPDQFIADSQLTTYIMFNGPETIPVGGYGRATIDFPTLATWSGTLAEGRLMGPKLNSWDLDINGRAFFSMSKHPTESTWVWIRAHYTASSFYRYITKATVPAGDNAEVLVDLYTLNMSRLVKADVAMISTAAMFSGQPAGATGLLVEQAGKYWGVNAPCD